MKHNVNQSITFTVHEDEDGLRIDSFLHHRLSEYSRTFFKNLLASKSVLCNNKVIYKPSTLVQAHDTILITLPSKIQKKPATIEKNLQEFPVTCLAETPDFLVINKPAGLLVHNSDIDPVSTTVVDWIQRNYPFITTVGEVGRSGIVHRLDRNTSGIMLIAKHNAAYKKLMDLFKQRKIKKSYCALVKGHTDRKGIISYPIGRHPHQRHKMIAYKQPPPPDRKVRDAETDYSVVEYFPDTTYLTLFPQTGRTHQIRVHMSTLGHPLIGDHIYGSSSPHISRHALHAQSLSFTLDGIPYHFSCPMPQDFLLAIDALK